MEDKRNYYAIIPAGVRYDSNLCPNSKLLYGEITALCNEKGYCWASNQYFADLYNVTKISISKWISALQAFGYIRIDFVYKENSKEIESRRIWITNKENNNPQPSIKEESKIKVETYKDEIKEIIDYLNKKAGCRYRYNTESTNKLIRSKLNNGFSVCDFKTVIDIKISDWKGTEFEKYLRPYTLFGNKFEQYLNQKSYKPFDSIHISNQNETSTTFNIDEPLRDNEGTLIIY